MNSRFILIIAVITGLNSCSTVYKAKQTPDDVYYSPAPHRNEDIQTNTDENTNVYNYALPEDHEILRHVRNRRWMRNHGYDYNYAYPYGYGYYPYGSNYPVYIDPKQGNPPPATYTSPRKYNLGTYTTPAANYTLDSKTGKIIPVQGVSAITSNGTPIRSFNRPAGTGVGNFIRRVFSNPNANSGIDNANSNSTQSRSFEPAKNNSVTNNSTSSPASTTRSSSSGGSAPVRSFHK